MGGGDHLLSSDSLASLHLKKDPLSMTLLSTIKSLTFTRPTLYVAKGHLKLDNNIKIILYRNPSLSFRIRGQEPSIPNEIINDMQNLMESLNRTNVPMK